MHRYIRRSRQSVQQEHSARNRLPIVFADQPPYRNIFYTVLIYMSSDSCAKEMISNI